jgi:hypothetical protein
MKEPTPTLALPIWRFAATAAVFLSIWLVVSSCALEQAMEASTSSGGVLFQDDFSDPSSGWLQGEDSLGRTEYYEGSFRIFVASDVAAKVAIPRLQFSDVHIQVETIKAAGPDDNEFGVICRYQDPDNFYFFTISSDGYYGIGKYRNNQLALIGMEKMLPSELIQQGMSLNYLRAECVGSTLAFFINGSKVGEVQDSDFKSGDVGLLAGSFRSPGVEILFDNFSVLKP